MQKYAESIGTSRFSSESANQRYFLAEMVDVQKHTYLTVFSVWLKILFHQVVILASF